MTGRSGDSSENDKGERVNGIHELAGMSFVNTLTSLVRYSRKKKEEQGVT